MRRRELLFSAMLMVLVFVGACGGQPAAAPAAPLVLSAIPDQDPEKLQRLYSTLSDYLSKELGIAVEYKPVTDYKAAVTAFKVGDLDMVWFGGLTGVQARLQVPGAQAIVQRDIDEQFHSVFIASTASGIQDLAGLKGHTFTFGSESSTSGRLMPQHYLSQEGIQLTDFTGEPGFSGSHDKTIELVTAGTYDAGVLNEQVWNTRLANGTIDTSKVQVIWTTPAYHDYHWVLNPAAIDRYGAGFVAKVQTAFFKLDPSVPEHQAILDLFGAKKFIATNNGNYTEIEQVGLEVGLIIEGAAGQ